MFVSPAFAQGAGGGSDIFGLLMPMLLILPIFYFLIIRPQQQRVKQHREMVANIRRNDTVVLSGGILGKVTKVKDSDNEVEVEIADNTRVRVLRHTIAEVRAKGEPVKDSTTA
ncbi:MAG TPA: preprotein translocase subunit YajC [Hyphomicrobiaceae bacterium]|nr:preprotein translocase subunit YajC [Hyphomicrobiaceae bacterium]